MVIGQRKKSKRNRQKQIWADEEFVKWLKKLRAKKELNGEDVSNLGEITRQIVDNRLTQIIENFLLGKKNENEIKIKFD